MNHLLNLRLVLGSLLCFTVATSAAAAQDAAFAEDDIEEVVEVPLTGDELGVTGSLRWIGKAQQMDGSWPAQFAPDEPKRMTLSANHATGLALLAFAGAGQTHKEGAYKKQVRAGIDYLVRQMREDDELGDLRGDGDLEGHGAAALALCEMYAMTHDPLLLVPAQLSVRFTERSQNPMTGGWKLQPNKLDDMHKMGWHVLTLRGAWQCYLLIREQTFPRLSSCLDRHQLEDGRWYGRIMPGKDPQATAIGLLGRAQTGWHPETNDRWRAGAAWLAEQKWAPHDAERNFWATLVVRQADDELWKKWNNAMRRELLDGQSAKAEHHGSWFDPKDINANRGRFYQTTLNTMCLEIYYRHLPVYRNDWPQGDKLPAKGGADPFGPDDDPFGPGD